MDIKPELPAHRYRDKWPDAAPDLGCSTRESTSSASGGSVLELVRKLSRTCSSRTSSIIKRVGWRPGTRMSWHASSVDGGRASGSQELGPAGCDGILEADIDPLLGSRGPRSSIRFSSYPSGTGTQRSRRMGEVFQSCRNKLSMNSLRESIDHMLDRDGGSAACYFQLSSSEPPRLDVLKNLDPSSPADDNFRVPLEEAIQAITAREGAADYVKMAELKPSPRASSTMPVRGKAAGSSQAAEAPKGTTAEPCEEPLGSEKPDIDRATLEPKRPSAEKSVGEASRIRLKGNACIRKAPEPRKGIPQLAESEPPGLSQSTARLASDLGIKVDVSRSHRITDTVKLIYPWFQETKGRLEICPSHETAMHTLQTMQLSHPVHDLAFYDASSRSYFLHPKCFLVDREVVELARSKGINLVSLSRRWQALRGDESATNLRPGELGGGLSTDGGASVRMAWDGEYVVISIHRSDASEDPVLIEEEDGEVSFSEDDEDTADEMSEL